LLTLPALVQRDARRFMKMNFTVVLVLMLGLAAVVFFVFF